jgi:hypothetical protein
MGGRLGHTATTHVVHGLVVFLAVVGATFVADHPGWRILVLSVGSVALFWIARVLGRKADRGTVSPPPPRPGSLASSPTGLRCGRWWSSTTRAITRSPVTPLPSRTNTGLTNCPYTTSTRTGSGARSSHWPANCSPGPNCAPSPSPARRWEPKRMRLRLLAIAGRLTRSGRRVLLHLPAHAPWAGLLVEAITTLRALAEHHHPPRQPRPPGPVEPAASRATSAKPSCPTGTINSRRPAPTGHDHLRTSHERSGLATGSATCSFVGHGWLRQPLPGPARVSEARG